MPGPSATKRYVGVFFSTFDYKALMTIDSIYAMKGKSVEVRHWCGRPLGPFEYDSESSLWYFLNKSLIILSRHYLLHGYRIQTTYFDRRGYSHRVSIPPILYMIRHSPRFQCYGYCSGRNIHWRLFCMFLFCLQFFRCYSDRERM